MWEGSDNYNLLIICTLAVQSSYVQNSALHISVKMSDLLSKEKYQLIDEIAAQEGITDYKLDVQSGSIKGDGYLGIINTIHIQDTKKPKKELRMVLKSALPGDKLREQFPVRKAYEREVYMYNTIFPTFKQFSEENRVTNRFTETAKCFGTRLTEKQECLLLEDLKQSNYKLWNRKIPINEEHLTLVFTTYGKFHGTGFALKLLHPEQFEKLKENLKNIIHVDENESDEERQKTAEDVRKAFANGFDAIGSNEKAINALKRFLQVLRKFFREDIRTVDKFSTILHGDSWVNNMMFKYTDLENPSRPTKICFLDWQLSTIGSPVLDLSYFFYASSGKDELYNLTKYLKIYYENLKRTVEEAGINPNEVFTFEELEEQWKIYSRFGLFMTFLLLRVILSDVEEAPDLSESAEKGKGFMESIVSKESSNMEEINKRIADVVYFMVEQDYL